MEKFITISPPFDTLGRSIGEIQVIFFHFFCVTKIQVIN